ncbi:McKusick-Kaufman/Bardet-Biedl syndromes putative chaperonin isoform X2 [Callorhinchus milii]|uniref:McKusick-Kaufman/Bardet-Biedl syndromes putative chaperonin isoform X2 n=1 Tax=Callorhinchus milii TaxID=7868 RepID=UPI001C3F9F80|nr:McKusick-Kaufman/Bardet-Biedl syndromes putative chaperonin isoform X2 [Callorhinchus milii]
MSCVASETPSFCYSGPLNNEDVCQAISTFRCIVQSCYGPFGRLKLIHNAMGGYVQTTSQSSALLRSVSVSHPVVKWLITSVSRHVSQFSDSGLFTAVLCCNLIEKAKRCNITGSRIVRIQSHLLNMCIDYLNSEECSCRIQIDFSHSKALLSLVRTVITSKPTCMLTVKEADYVSSLILKAFLHTVPSVIGEDVSLGQTLIVSAEGQRVSDSRVFPGLLIQISISHSRTIQFAKRTLGPFKVALFDVSMSGEVVDSGIGTWVVESGSCLEDWSLTQLMRVGKQLARDQVGLVLCQKVIHPILKQYLWEQDVMVEDRLGAALVEPLTKMTESISSYQRSIPANCYGKLKSWCVVKFGSKQFLHLIPVDDSPVCSLLLCNRSEAGLNELKVVCQTAEHVLRLTLKQPLGLLGGGCTEAHLTTYVRHKSCCVPDDALAELGCSRAQYRVVADCFCRSLDHTTSCLEHDGGESLVDSEYGHRWSVPLQTPLGTDWSQVVSNCACGLHGSHQDLLWTLLRNRSEVVNKGMGSAKPCTGVLPDRFLLDSFPVKLNALQVAVETANVILQLQYVIQAHN